MCGARHFAEACADAVPAGHDEAAGASGEALALPALEEVAGHQVLLECIVFVHRVKAVDDDILVDLVADMNG